jgi:amino acid permease
MLFGALMVFYLFLGEYGAQAIAFFTGKSLTPQLVSLGFLLVPILPLSCLRSLSALGTVSLFGMLIMTLIAMLCVGNYLGSEPMLTLVQRSASPAVSAAFERDVAKTLPWFVPLTAASLNAFGAFITIFTNHFGVVTNVRQMDRPTPRRLAGMLLASTVIVVGINVGISWFSYAFFRNARVKDPLDVPKPTLLFALAKLGVSLNLALTFPLLLDSLRSAVDRLVVMVVGSKVDATKRHYCETLAIVLVPYLVYVPFGESVINVFDLFSALFRVIVVLIMPAWMFLRCGSLTGKRRWERIAACLIITFGALICVLGPIPPFVKLVHKPLPGPLLASFK